MCRKFSSSVWCYTRESSHCSLNRIFWYWTSLELLFFYLLISKSSSIWGLWITKKKKGILVKVLNSTLWFRCSKYYCIFVLYLENCDNGKYEWLQLKKNKKKGCLSLTTTTKRSWSKEDHVHQGQYQRKKMKKPCVEEEIIDGLEGSSLQKIIKKKAGSL